MLTKPFLAKCGDRSSMPKSHPSSGSPEEWLSDEMLAPHNLSGITFDFFVNWSATPNSITPVIWLKRILLPEFSYQQVLENLENILIEEFGSQQLRMLKSFGANNAFSIQFIIFNDNLNWSNSTSELLVVDLLCNNDANLSFIPSVVSIDNFKVSIRENSGGAIQIGSKGLIYGTSNLECHLSGTNSLYPGDVDLIILDSESKPLCILEFKKHTLNTSISLQQISNYYPYPDGRKYNRLAILKDYLSENTPNIPFFIVYYPTNSAFTEGRLELLKGAVGSLATKAASNFLLPTDNSTLEYNKIIEKLIKAIAYHNSQA